MHAEEIEIKIAQGSKPGEGGQLPGHKVTELIARLRHAQPGVQLISPPPHHDIYSIEDLAQLIYDLKRVNPRAAIGVKLVSEYGVGTVAAGVAKAYADYIVIAGHAGGTGASPLSSIKYAGNPGSSASLKRSRYCYKMACAAASGSVATEAFAPPATSSSPLFSEPTSTLSAPRFSSPSAATWRANAISTPVPTGIATQRPDLRAKFRGKPEHVVRFFEELTRDLQVLLSKVGLPSLESAIGRTDLLEQVRFDGSLDLAPVLAAPHSGEAPLAGPSQQCVPPTTPRSTMPGSSPLSPPTSDGQHFIHEALIANEDRTFGARLAGELAVLNTNGTTSDAAHSSSR